MTKLVSFSQNIIKKIVANKKYFFIALGILILLIFIKIIFIKKPEYKIDINNETWFQKFNSNEEFVTLIYRNGCYKCEEYLEILSTISKKYKKPIYYYNTSLINETEDKNIWNVTKATGTPSLVIVKNGNVENILIGSKSSEEVINFLKQNNVL